MFKFSFLALSVVVLVGCSSSVERQFMKGCTQGQGASKSVCSCVYDKMEDNYGEKALQSMNEGGYLPDDFGSNMISYAQSCQ